jgi:hypothetical protein
MLGCTLIVVGNTAFSAEQISSPAEGPTDIVINEVYYVVGDTGEDPDWIELKNTGSDTIDISDWWLCSRFSYKQLSELTLLDGNNLILEPGEIVTVQAWTDLDDVAADLGLFTVDQFADPAAMVDFVQWGTADDVGRSDVAAAALMWTEVVSGEYDFVPSASIPDRESVAYQGSNSGGGLLTLSSDFVNGPTSRGAENPAPAGEPTDIVINEVYYVVGGAGEDPDWIELKNTGDSTIDVSDWWLCSEFQYEQLSNLTLLDGDDLTLEPGEILTLQAWVDLNNTAADLGLFTVDQFADPAAMVDFVQWGTAADVGRPDVAVAALMWTEVVSGEYDFVPSASIPDRESAAYQGSNSGGALLTLSSDFVNGPTSRGAENPAPPQFEPTDIVINEVYYVVGGAGEDPDWIELKNTGSDTIDISDWWLCSRFSYEQLSEMSLLEGEDLILEPGAIAVVQAWTDLDDVTADLGLYTVNEFANPDAMVDFLQWGTDEDVGRSDVAVAALMWTEVVSGEYDFVPSASIPDRESVAYLGSNSGGDLLTLSSDFVNGPTSRGVDNPQEPVVGEPTDIVINEVYYVEGGDGEEPDWIELKNIGEGTIDIGEWWLCSVFSYQQLNTMTLLDGEDLILGPGEIVVLQAWRDLDDTAADLGLFAFDEFANPEAIVDFVQWGTADDVGRPDVAVDALLWTEVVTDEYDFVPSASIEDRESAAYLGSNSGGDLLTLSIDFVNGPTSRGVDNPQAAPITPTDIVINEVYYVVGDAGEPPDWIELKNTGSDTIDVSRWWLCSRFSYEQLSELTLLDGDDLILEPGEIVTVQAWTDLDDVAADLGLYTINEFANPDAMVDFVQWGTAEDVGRSDVAVAALMWTEVVSGEYDFVPSASIGDRESTAYQGTNSGGGLLTLSNDFTNGPTSRGVENPPVVSTNPTDIVINEVYYVVGDAGEPPDWIELKNTGNDTIDISDWWLCSRFSYKQLSELTLLDGNNLILEPGEILTVQAWTDLDDIAADLGLFTVDQFADPAAMVDFVQWGTAEDVGRSDVAAAALMWTEVVTGEYDFVPSASIGDRESAAYQGTNSGGGLLTLSSDFVNGPTTRGEENEQQGDDNATDIVINEVYYVVGGAGEPPDWIELKNTGNDTIDISNWWLCSEFQYEQLSNMTLLDGDDLTLGPGEILTVQAWVDLNNTAADLGLYTVNEFANPDAMVDFLQWGTDASIGRSTVAVEKGVWSETAPGVYDFVPSASIGNRESAAYQGSNRGGGLLTLSSDFANGPTSRGAENEQPQQTPSAIFLPFIKKAATPQEPEPPQGEPTDIVINEVYYVVGGAGEPPDWIELKNTGDGTIDISEWWLCSEFQYEQLANLTLLDGTDLTLEPGEIVTVQAWADLNDTAADLGLYTVNEFASADAMVDFLQWGTDASIGRSTVAVEKGIWSETAPGVYDFVPSASIEDRESAAYQGSNSGGGLLTLSSDFANGPTSRGVENPAPQEPAPEGEPTDIAINEVYYVVGGDGEAPDWIELKNTGDGTIDLSEWWLCSEFQYEQLSNLTLLDGDDLTLEPGEILTLQAWVDLNNTAADLGLYTVNEFASAAAMVDFVQWGTDASIGRSTVAVEKGVWSETAPGVYDFVPSASIEDRESATYQGSNSGGGLLTLSSDFANGPTSRGQENP